MHEIRESADRLQKLLRLDSPPEMISKEIALLLHKAVMEWGPLPMEKLAEIMRYRGLIHRGRCVECETHFATAQEICPACSARLESEVDKAEGEE